MLRLGLVGGVRRWHARTFAGILNPKDEEAWAAAGYPAYPSWPVEGVTVAALCDEDLAGAREIADRVDGIDLVTDDPRALLGRVEGVLVCDDATGQHQKRAPLFLEAGLPTFIDKPLSHDPAEAEALFEIADRHGAPMMSCSALRYSTELAAVDRGALGDLLCMVAVGPGELVSYGIHPCELLQAALGPGVRSVRDAGDGKRHHIHLDYGDGRAGIVVVRQDIAYTFRATLLGASGSTHLTIDDSAGFYRGMLVRVIEMVRTGVAPIPPAHTLEILRILAAAEQARVEGREIRLHD